MSALRSIKRSSPCPCRSGATYGACCGPLHRGEREAPDPATLARSRYAAFATADIDYLIRTLHPDHVDLALPEEVLRSTLGAACREHRYTGFEVLESDVRETTGTVRFRARVFRRGVDLTFVERSRFEKIGSGWRYRDGETG